jgi:hypothetical protein
VTDSVIQNFFIAIQCNITSKTVYLLAFSILINLCTLIAMVEVMGNQMAEMEDTKFDPETTLKNKNVINTSKVFTHKFSTSLIQCGT